MSWSFPLKVLISHLRKIPALVCNSISKSLSLKGNGLDLLAPEMTEVGFSHVIECEFNFTPVILQDIFHSTLTRYMQFRNLQSLHIS